MNTSQFRHGLAILSCLVLNLGGSVNGFGQDQIDNLVDELIRLTNVAQRDHVQPPVRQQMMLAAMRAVADAVDRPLSVEQTQSFSDVSADQLRPLVKQLLEQFRQPASGAGVPLRSVAIPGLLHSLPGSVQVFNAEDLEVQRGSDRFLSNTYVGIGIALKYDKQHKVSIVTEVIESGPGYTAGLQAGDRIEMVDGRDVHGLPLQEMIKLLRGPEDSTLELVVRQPESAEARQLQIIRRIVPRELVGEYRVVDDNIAYLKVDQIAASTVHELRKFEHRARQDDCRALVLDLRGCGQSELHYCVTLGDALLDDQPLGQLRTTSEVALYTAQPESLFPGWPLAVLLNRETSDHAAWLAASLRANRRAHVLGFDFNRQNFDHAPVAVPDSELSIIMATGRLSAPPQITGTPETVTVPLLVTARESPDQVVRRATKLLSDDA